jgi:hypothetical protein
MAVFNVDCSGPTTTTDYSGIGCSHRQLSATLCLASSHDCHCGLFFGCITVVLFFLSLPPRCHCASPALRISLILFHRDSCCTRQVGPGIRRWFCHQVDILEQLLVCTSLGTIYSAQWRNSSLSGLRFKRWRGF